MTDTLMLLARRYSADSPIAYLLDLAEQAAGPTDREQRDDAETAAAHHTYTAYGSTLGQAVDAEAWQGYPAVYDNGARRWEASAVAWLDGGLWLHHTLRISEHDGATDVLTLVVPCTCGRGYIDMVIDAEGDLMEILSELRPTAGLSPHNERHPSDCRSVTTTPYLEAVAAWR
ncbi:hypothetical protein [Streptomyces sp. NBC_01455]|uniref:hypothetical protein n=1 Tax=Streptomyces sp. NBC_01455 TaxID=2903874 RepID=UPI002E361D24|nr:hypothetical protein [Streptomyces sp. NBC_01455]